MRSHHTKDKGDKGLGFVIADLLSHGIQIALPISEHLPFDCIAINNKGDLFKISVKFRKKDKNGLLVVKLQSTWTDKNGVHRRPAKPGDFDVVAIYSPDTGRCHYMSAEDAMQSTSISLRVDPPKKAQKGMRFASDYQDPTQCL